MKDDDREEIAEGLFGNQVRVSMVFLGMTIVVTVMGILFPGIWWIVWVPLFLLGAFISGTTLGSRLGLIPFVANLLAVLGFALDFWVMPSGLGSAFLKALAIFLLFCFGGVQGWFYMARRIGELSEEFARAAAENMAEEWREKGA